MAGHRTDCHLAREYEMFKAMWHIAIEENTRKELLGVWNLGWEPRACGLWHEFLVCVAGYGGRLGQGGSILFERLEVELHLNMPAVIFKHQVRALQRTHLLAQAKEAVPGTYDLAPEAVDWDSTRKKLPCSTARATVMSNGVNTLKRAFYHFHSVPDPLCEHQCGAEDDVSHRVLDCCATQGLRRECGLCRDELALLRDQKRATTECGIWEFSASTRAHRVRVGQGQALWPDECWLRTIIEMQDVNEIVPMQFVYQEVKGEVHPELKRHAAQVLLEEGFPELPQATSRIDCYQRSHWEMDAVILATMIAAVKQVTVEIGGLNTNLEDIQNAIQQGKSANVYLRNFCTAAKHRVRQVEHPELADVIAWEDILPPDWVRMEWNRQHMTATKLHKFFDAFLEMYPTAHQASRQHGLRGGNCDDFQEDYDHGMPVVDNSCFLDELYLTVNWPTCIIEYYVRKDGPYVTFDGMCLVTFAFQDFAFIETSQGASFLPPLTSSFLCLVLCIIPGACT